MTKIIAAALIASAAFASTASAFDYYQGVLPAAGLPEKHSAQNVDSKSASYGYTGSIAGVQNGRDADGTVVLNRGDYYEGANRPN